MNYLLIDEHRGNIDLIENSNNRHDVNSLFSYMLKQNMAHGYYTILTEAEAVDLKRESKYFSVRENVEDFLQVNKSRKVKVFDEFKEYSGKIRTLKEAHILLFSGWQACGFGTSDAEHLSNSSIASFAQEVGITEDPRYIILTREEADRYRDGNGRDGEALREFIRENLDRHVLLIPACLCEAIDDVLNDIRAELKVMSIVSDLDALRSLIDDR